MKKVLFVHHGSGVGGAAISLLQMILALDKRRYQPVVVFLKHSSAVDLYASFGVNVDEILGLEQFSHTRIWQIWPWQLHLIFRVLVDQVKLLWYVPYLVQKYRPSIVHLNSSPLFCWLPILSFFDVSIVSHIREPLAEGFFGLRCWLIKTIILRYSHRILSISKFDGQPFSSSEKLMVLYNSVDQERFKYLECARTKSQPLKLLYVGGASEEKGILFLLDLYEQLVKSKNGCFELWLAGDFEFRYSSNPLTKMLQLNFGKQKILSDAIEAKLEKIHKNGGIVKNFGVCKNIENVMAIADLLLFPCQVGHFARPVIEAAMLGKISIASKLAPLDELIGDGQTGFLVDHKSIESWKKLLLFLSQNPALVAAMQHKAYIQACKKFSLSQQIELLMAVYDGLVYARGNSASVIK